MSEIAFERREGVSEDVRVLKEVSLLVGDRRIRYGLVSFEEQYLLKLEGNGMSCMLDLGDTLSCAARTMELFVSGRVTPETAEEIWEDLYAQGAFEEKSAW